MSVPGITNGEVCTYLMGSSLGLVTVPQDDMLHPKINMADLRVFNDKIDSDPKRNKSICNQSANGKKASMHCIIEHGMGMMRKPDTDPNVQTCTTYQCPSNPNIAPNSPFSWSNSVDGSNCYKPLVDAIIDKRSKCDERWYDWFTTPNYHLGNKYESEKEGVCRAPCPKGYVPYNVIDPVDGSKMSLTGTNRTDKCVATKDFFYGKYDGNSDYCPLAMIHRVHSTPQNVYNKLGSIYTKYGLQVTNEGRNNIDASFAQFTGDSKKQALATEISKKALTNLDNVPEPNEAGQAACSTLNSNRERVTEAYDICSAVKANTYKAVNPNHIPVLQQACNAVFCSENNDAPEIIGKDRICFANPEQVDASTLDTTSPDDLPDDETPTADGEVVFLMSSFPMAMAILISLSIGVLLYLAWKDFIEPKIIIPVYRRVSLFFSKDEVRNKKERLFEIKDSKRALSEELYAKQQQLRKMQKDLKNLRKSMDT